MSFLSELIGRARGLLARPEPPVQATDAVRHDRFDQQTFSHLLEEAPALSDLVTQLNEKYDYTEDLVRDVFMQFWQADPQVRPESEMRPGWLTNHGVIKDLAQVPETPQTRQYTRHDAYGAAMATIGVSGKVREFLAEHRETQEAAEQAEQAEQEHQDAMQQLAQALAQAQAAAQAAEDAEGEDGEGGEGGPTAEELEAMAQALEQAVGQAQQAQQAAQDATQQAQDAQATTCAGVRAQVREAVQEATDELADEAEMFAAWGIGEGELKRMDFTERARIATLLRGSKLAKYQQLIGRFKLMAAAQRTKRVEFGRDDVIGTELSGDLGRVVGGEYARLSNPALRRDFNIRLAERRLVSRKYVGREQVGQGAIIVCIDESGSMESADTGGITREAWAKAFALALLDQARLGGRDFVAISFSSGYEQKVWRFPKGQGPIEEVVAFVEHFYGGGTNFDKPLDMAMDVLEAEFNDYRKARGDIVFITDDDCMVTPRWMGHYQERKAQLDFRTFGIAVGTGFGHVLEAVSDNVRSVTEFADPDGVADIMRVIR